MTDYIHHDPDRTCYSVTEDELNNIVEKAQPLWRDVCIASLFFGLPTFINAIAETTKQNAPEFTWSLLLNYIFGILGLVLAIIFGIAWKRSHKSTKDLVDKIKAKPKIELNPSTSNVGALDEVKKEIEELKNKPATWG
ncbi:MAG: hypothetical protein WCW66_04425 [Patescibacteria group bacterium]